MMESFHKIVVVVYLAAPVLALMLAVAGSRRRDSAGPVIRFVLTCAAGALLGAALTLIYAAAIGGGVVVGQVLLAGYFGTGLLVVLKGFDWLLRTVFGRLLSVDRQEVQSDEAPAGRSDEGNEGGAGEMDDADAHPASARRRTDWRAQTALGLRVVVLFAVGLPYVMASVMTYRPKVSLRADPARVMGYLYDRVEFASTDGTRLAGWWIPAQGSPGRVEQSDRTVIVCHGLAANKLNHLILARELVPHGYNVLIFDFRAHGESGGQLTSFGDLERRDVLGAVRWLRGNQPEASRRLFGVGASMGGAALIAAAAEPVEEGRSIEAVAVYGTYNSLPQLARAVGEDYFPPALRGLVVHLGLPMAGAQVGAPLWEFSPGELSGDLWPRPILVIHSWRDEIVRFELGRQLYHSAHEPKGRLWLREGRHDTMLGDESAGAAMRDFFERAEAVPVL